MTKVEIKIVGAKSVKFKIHDARKGAQKVVKNALAYGVVDKGTWHPPNRIKSISFDPDPGFESPFMGRHWGQLL